MRRRTFVRAALGTTLAAPLARVFTATSLDDKIAAVRLSGQPTTVEAKALRELASRLRGKLLLADNPEYDAARRVWNRMIDKRPAMVVQCADTADVAHAINFARERELLLAVRGGGHSFPGLSTCDGGMLLDLSPMKSVRVDTQARRVFAAGGVWGGHVDGETQQHGLATTMGQISDTGIGGLTLGGGFGWLSRLHGLACDNLASVELVTADGKSRRVSRDENADLFWGLRGGGGNFGVATSFEYRLHPVPQQALGGGLSWRAADASAVIDFYRETTASGPRELSLDLGVWHEKDTGKVFGIETCCTGDLAAGTKVIESMRRIGKPLTDTVRVKNYVDIQRQFDDGNISARYHYLKAGFVRAITPAFEEFLVREFEPTIGMGIYMQNASGAVGDVAPDATAFWNRKNIANLMIMSAWGEPGDTERNRAAVRAAWDKAEPHTSGYYVNLSDAARNTVGGNYGGNYPRLLQLKQKYDPMNLFRLNSNIAG